MNCERCGFCAQAEFVRVMYAVPVIAEGKLVGHINIWRHRPCRTCVAQPVAVA